MLLMQQGAEEFRAAKRGRDAPPENKTRPGSKRTRGIAFGTGVLDEDDAYGMTQDYVMEAEPKAAFNFEIASDEEDAPRHGPPCLLTCYIYHLPISEEGECHTYLTYQSDTYMLQWREAGYRFPTARTE